MISIIEAPKRNFYPVAHVTYGSVIIHVSWGITRWHALGRAARWAREHCPDEQIRVARWATP